MKCSNDETECGSHVMTVYVEKSQMTSLRISINNNSIEFQSVDVV